MKYALKEWNTTIEALGKGLITAIWRKGTINDSPGVKTPYESFNVEQNQFVFFPTLTNEEPEKIKRDLWLLFDPMAKPNKDNQAKIKYWAKIEEEISIGSLTPLLSISKELANSEEYLKNSWDLYPSHSGKIFLLRVYSLNDPILVPNSPEYAKCKSWIELKIDVPKVSSKPILSFKDFNRKARLIKALLEECNRTEKVLV